MPEQRTGKYPRASANDARGALPQSAVVPDDEADGSAGKAFVDQTDAERASQEEKNQGQWAERQRLGAANDPSQSKKK